jgi:hypothetical protein
VFSWFSRLRNLSVVHLLQRPDTQGVGPLADDGAKHIAPRARSVNSKRAPFTASGLGDRIHLVTLAWVFANVHDVDVVLHLTKSKQSGGQFNNKLESWHEILELMPPGRIRYSMHDFEPNSEKEWISYLHARNIPAEPYWYGDHPGRFDTRQRLNAADYLRAIPPVPAADLGCDIVLPPRFATLQWDTTDAKRSLSPEMRETVMAQYRSLGLELVTVGGEAPDPLLKNSLRHIAYAMSRATLHVGVDSAFMHMAFMYMPFERIHLYNPPAGFRSHHLRRALDNGCEFNKFYRNYSVS